MKESQTRNLHKNAPKAILFSCSLFVFLFLYKGWSNNDLEQNKVENYAIVQTYNRMEGWEGDYHKLSFTYEFNGMSYCKLYDMSLLGYIHIFKNAPKVGDTIQIIHSSENPENVKVLAAN